MKITHNKVRMTKGRKLIIMAAEFYTKVLKIAKADYTIKIRFSNNLMKRDNIHAQCHPPTKDNVIVIDIDTKIDKYFVLEILAHEMVHAKQFIKKQLDSDNEGNLTWKGNNILASTPYHKHPWEIEAMKRQAIMAMTFSHNLG